MKILFMTIELKEIPDTKYHLELNIPTMNDEYIYGKNDIFQ